MADDLTIRPGLVVPAAELHEEASTAGGPGGQHANKNETAVSIRWSVRDSAVLSDYQRARLLDKLDARLTKEGELLVQARDTRSRYRNRQLARRRLVEIVLEALAVQAPRRPTRPTKGSQRRRVTAKKARGAIKSTRASVQDDD